MKICLLGEFNGTLDEGMRKTSAHILRELRQYHDVLPLDLRKVSTRDFWLRLRVFSPQIIHYLHGSSLKSFILLKIISYFCRNAKTVISIVLPRIDLSKRFISFFGPDLVLVPSMDMQEVFETLKFRSEIFPFGGVNVEKFNPKLKKDKEKLREKYGINKHKFVILHVGHVKKGRNVSILKKLQRESKENQVIIVGSTSTKVDYDVLNELKNAGCLVWNKYFERIEEIYALSDCYVFPTKSKDNAIQMPLSVLEAMACNLPVITTRFGALPQIFCEGDGLIFADSENDFIEALKLIKTGIKVKTRKKVLPYSWKNVVKRLEDIYLRLISGD